MDYEDDQPSFERDEFEFAFELSEPDPITHAITLTCHPSRKLHMDDYIEALRNFIEQLDIAETYEEHTRGILN